MLRNIEGQRTRKKHRHNIHAWNNRSSIDPGVTGQPSALIRKEAATEGMIPGSVRTEPCIEEAKSNKRGWEELAGTTKRNRTEDWAEDMGTIADLRGIMRDDRDCRGTVNHMEQTAG